ncbi:MAG: glycosyltransferase family 2 protein [Planctomycetia bacterium]|nr:glycosyltransferase family 2 protein [Planctomycetia bacterium]
MSDCNRDFLPADVAIAIPTLGRDQILVDTIESCLRLPELAGEIVVIDQTPAHDQPTEKALGSLNERGAIRWVRMAQASIPVAMNRALMATELPLVLYLDDDVVPAEGLVREHVKAHNEFDPWVVVGQIIQPWQEATDITPSGTAQGLLADFDFPFHSTRAGWLQNAMATNMSVRRDRTLAIGGFDENFQGAAYRFETEFARRVIRSGGRIRFCPTSSIRHLRAERGGTRHQGNHLASADPRHGVGDYYFAMREGWNAHTVAYMAKRLVREVTTRFHLKHPWYIPVKLVGELRALGRALRLRWSGPALLPRPQAGAAATAPGPSRSPQEVR